MSREPLNEDLLRAMTRQLEQDRREEREHLDERWDRLAADELDADERAEIEALATGAEETRMAYEAFRPLGADFRQRVVGALMEQRNAERAAAADGRDRNPGTATVLPFRRMRRLVGGGLAAAALAASLLFVFSPATFLPGAGTAAIADYELEISGGLRTERSTAPETAEPVFVRGMELELVLRPVERIEGEVTAELFAESAAGELVALVPQRLDLAASGALRVAAAVDELGLAPGSHTLHVLVGRPGALPDEDPRTLSAAGEGWRYLRGSMRIGQNP